MNKREKGGNREKHFFQNKGIKYFLENNPNTGRDQCFT